MPPLQILQPRCFLNLLRFSWSRWKSISATAFLKDGLTESLDQVISRIESLIEIIKNNQDKNILCVSHAFYMRLIQQYLQDRKIFDSLDDLIENFNPRQKPFEPLGGFFIDHSH
ncbi:MAG: histidine phosphatase family protein [Candidatus Omnitrophota bacterium]|nr:histidine phosphatase family protein [Candidatus Omnitrophota bacterium]